MDHSLSVIGMWVQLSWRAVCNNRQTRFYIAEKHCGVGCKFSKFGGGIEYKFSVGHFPLWCYKCKFIIS
jgi:hypothetical protein